MKSPNRQTGATLLVAMIMLVLITLVVINTVNLGSGSIQTVSNMQFRNQATAAAEEALQEAISSTRFFNTPSTVYTTPCDGSYNAKCFDTNSDGVNDITVTLTRDPTCVQARVINNSELDMTIQDMANCAVQADQRDFGLGASTDRSLCAQSIWELQAAASDLVTQANAVVTQGVSVTVKTDAVDTSCP